jgi:hypothetical protein
MIQYYFLWFFCKELHLSLLVYIGRDVFVLELDNDVYEEVVKPLLEKSKPKVEHVLSTWPPLDSPLEKKARINKDCE